MIVDRHDTLVARIRRGFTVGADRSSLHEAIVPHDATEDEFFLAYKAAEILSNDE